MLRNTLQIILVSMLITAPFVHWGTASPSQETPVILGIVVDESEFRGDLFFLIAVNEDPEDTFWVRMDEETLLKNEFGEEIPVEYTTIGSTLIILCYELGSTIKIIEAIIFIPEDEHDEEDEDQE